MASENTPEQMEAFIKTAVDAVGVDDYATASRALTQAQIILAFVPNMQRNNSGIFYRDAVNNLQQVISRKKSATVVTTKIRHVRPGHSGHHCGGDDY